MNPAAYSFTKGPPLLHTKIPRLLPACKTRGRGWLCQGNPAQACRPSRRQGRPQGGGTSAASASAGPVAIACQAAEKAVTKIKETVENIAARAQSSKQTLSALAALFLVPLLILAGIAGVLKGGGFASNVNLSSDVMALMPQINAACQANGIPEYAPLVAAVMMQESGGNVALTNGDVMQCAESLG